MNIRKYIGVQVMYKGAWHTLNKIAFIAVSSPTRSEITEEQARARARLAINNWARYEPNAPYRVRVGNLGSRGEFVPE